MCCIMYMLYCGKYVKLVKKHKPETNKITMAIISRIGRGGGSRKLGEKLFEWRGQKNDSLYQRGTDGIK